jgi:hypothetical protein
VEKCLKPRCLKNVKAFLFLASVPVLMLTLSRLALSSKIRNSFFPTPRPL